MSGNRLYWWRSDLLPIAVLALVAVLVLGFRAWTGTQAAAAPDSPPVYAADNAPLADAWPGGRASAVEGQPAGPLGGRGFGSCCAVAQGGCGYGAGVPAALGPGTFDPSALEQAARDMYRQQTGDSGPVEVRLRDFGCHLQADIYRDAKRVKSYSFRGGEWQDIYY